MQKKENTQQEIKPVAKLKATLDVKEKDKPKKKEEEPMVEGIFKNWEVAGAPAIFSVSFTKAPAKKYTLQDGGKYTLPLKVAKHINTCSYPVSENEVDKRGHYLGKREGMVRRYTFRRFDDLVDNID